MSSFSRFSEADSLLAILGRHLDQMSRRERLLFELGSSSVSGNRGETLRLYRLITQEDPEFDRWYGLGRRALTAGYATEALEALNSAPEEYRENQWPWYWEHLAWANYLLGHHQQALVAAQAGRTRFPEFVRLRWREIQALIALGRLEEVEPLLDPLERMDPDEITSPGSILRKVATDLLRFEYPEEEALQIAERSIEWFEARDPGGYPFEKGQALLLAGRPAEALALIEPLAEENPEDLDLRGLLGVALALAGDEARAEAQTAWFRDLHLPFLQGEDTYWRAVVLAHLGQEEESIRLLRQAFEEGLSHMDRDPDQMLMPLWGYEPFEQLIAPKG